MLKLEKTLRALFIDMKDSGMWDWQLLEEIKCLHRFNLLANKIIKLANAK